MIKFTKPENMEGIQLREELRSAGIEISDDIGAVRIEENDLFLDIDSSKKNAAQTILDAHVVKPRPEPTVEEKLASVGLKLEDLKSALGL